MWIVLDEHKEVISSDSASGRRRRAHKSLYAFLTRSANNPYRNLTRLWCTDLPCRKSLERRPRVERALNSRRGIALRQAQKEDDVNLLVWLPAMFALGLVSIGLCYAFVFACEDI